MTRRALIALAFSLSACGSAPPPGTLQLAPDAPSVAGTASSQPPAQGTGASRNTSPPVARVEPPYAPPATPTPAPSAIPAPPDVAAPPPTAQRTQSGLASLVIRPGSGTAHPQPTSTVSAHYTGWTTDGRMFDSSVQRGAPFTARLDQVIPGFSEGLQLMVEGEQRRLWIPESLAYRGRPGPPAGMLVFDIELIRIMP